MCVRDLQTRFFSSRGSRLISCSIIDIDMRHLKSTMSKSKTLSAMRNSQRAMNTMVSMCKRTTVSCIANGLPMLSLLVWWAISVSTYQRCLLGGVQTECEETGIVGIARRTKKGGDISYSCNTPSCIDNWDVNAHVMTRNKYGVFEILVDPTADGKVAIPHGSKIKVKFASDNMKLRGGLTNLTVIRSL